MCQGPQKLPISPWKSSDDSMFNMNTDKKEQQEYKYPYRTLV
jgi:hypothetical protein